MGDNNDFAAMAQTATSLEGIFANDFSLGSIMVLVFLVRSIPGSDRNNELCQDLEKICSRVLAQAVAAAVARQIHSHQDS